MTPEQIKQWRTEHNLTQRECAEYAAVNIRSWQKWEEGKHPAPAMLVKILAAWKIFPGRLS